MKHTAECRYSRLIHFREKALLPQHSFPYLEAESLPERGRNGVPNLAMLVPDRPRKLEVITENTIFILMLNI